MPIETNLNSNPYWDDYEENKDFYKVLFKPGVSVQTRELNQLQTILQKQIERFGDHVFKSGTIVSGVNFTYNSRYPYVKILDLQEDGQPVDMQNYVGLYAKSSSNLQSVITHVIPGFETKNPDLNTLYVKYINSGNTNSQQAYSNNDVIELFSPENVVYDVDVINGGLGFSNSDSLFVISAAEVEISSGSFSNADVIVQATTGARSQIVGIFDGANSTTKILSLKPLNSDISNTSGNSAVWTIQVGYNVTNSAATANVISLIGSGATGSIITDSLGIVQDIVMSNRGSDYTTIPKAIIKPTSGSASVSTLNLSPRGYVAKVRVANNSFTAPVGYGYSFAVTDGVIFQKGIFSKVEQQFVVVSKYSSSPNNLSVGFRSDEIIQTYTSDTSLYDNASNTFNEGAPGADRLSIKPTLFVTNTDVSVSNSEFLPLVEFTDGRPSKENRNSVYNELAKEFELRTYESSGDFVINTFRVSTEEKQSNTTHFSVVIDPGVCYISGRRIQTVGFSKISVPKANTVGTETNQTITANFGNYVQVTNLAGFFNFKAGDSVTLYDTAQNYLQNVTVGSSATITPSGNAIGTAKVRSLVYESGIMGTPAAVYKLYLFEISMNSGRSFSNVKSFYYDGSYDGIADALQNYNAVSNTYITKLVQPENPDVIFNIGRKAIKSISDVTYDYRTSSENITLNSNGSLQITAPVTYVFPYSGSLTLSENQKQDFYVAPVANVQTANITGTVSVSTTSSNVTGTSTTFLTDLSPGDYIRVFNGASSDVKRVLNIVNNTFLTVSSNLSFTNTTSNTCLIFPAYYPIPIHDRSDRTIITSANAAVVTISTGKTLTSSVNAICFYNIRVPSATQINKDLNRDLYVKIYTGNNTTVSVSGNNTTGPWSLGIPDVFRLKKVYFGNTTSDVDVTNSFYINSYNDGDFIRNAELRLIPGSGITISNTQWLLVQFDAFDVNSYEGFVNINSYNDIINDSAGYSNNTFINRLEVPETMTSEGRYYDSIDCFDFRPFVTNTAVFSTTVGGATINPANTQNLNSDEKYLPVPDSTILFDYEFFEPRADRVIVNREGQFKVLQGSPSILSVNAPGEPTEAMTIGTLQIPQYPSLSFAISNTTFNILDKKIGNEIGIVDSRQSSYKITTSISYNDQRASPQAYTMTEINKLERRIETIEQTLSLSRLENSIKELTIPSSNDPTINRFKNAFLVDDFTDFSKIDFNSLEQTADIHTDP